MKDKSKSRADGIGENRGYYNTSRSNGVEREASGTDGQTTDPDQWKGRSDDLAHGEDLAERAKDNNSQVTPSAKPDLADVDKWPNRRAKSAPANTVSDLPAPPPVPAPRPETRTNDRPANNRSVPRPANPPVRESDSRRRRGPYTRETDRLSDTAVTELDGAARHADLIGSPLNVAVTINLHELREAGSRRSLATKKPNQALLAFRHSLRRFFRGQGLEHTGMWVREIDFIAGEHVHMAIHVPDHLLADFAKFIAKYTGIAQGAPRPGKWRDDHVANSEDTSWLLVRIYDAPGWVRYMLKGRDGSQGTVLGKRAGCTKNIGASSQRDNAGR